MSASLFLIGNVACSPFIYPLASKLGLRYLVIMACGIMTFGAFLRTFVNGWFDSLLLGQMVIGAAICFIINIQIQFCYNWFHPSNRPIYISLVSVMNIFGGGIGNLIPLIFVDADDKNITAIRSAVGGYTMFIFWVCLVFTVITVFLFQDKPPQGYGSAK